MLSRRTSVWVPVSPTSGSTQFPVPNMLIGVPDLLFQFVNPNPFAVAFEGTPAGASFNEAMWPSASWLILPMERTQVYISKQPVTFSAVAADVPGCPLPGAGFSYSNCMIGLVYGTGRLR